MLTVAAHDRRNIGLNATKELRGSEDVSPIQHCDNSTHRVRVEFMLLRSTSQRDISMRVMYKRTVLSSTLEELLSRKCSCSL